MTTISQFDARQGEGKAHNCALRQRFFIQLRDALCFVLAKLARFCCLAKATSSVMVCQISRLDG
ncbi:MAG: hypothetical protein DI541_10980 [Aeromonas media]|nr:MAG: hypothetical protein DI541_10980 [Aeromonas media]